MTQYYKAQMISQNTLSFSSGLYLSGNSYTVGPSLLYRSLKIHGEKSLFLSPWAESGRQFFAMKTYWRRTGRKVSAEGGSPLGALEVYAKKLCLDV